MRPMRRLNRRGYTLVELIVAGAVGALLLVAAMSALTLQQSIHRSTDRLLTLQTNAALGVSAITRDLENVGFHFSPTTTALRPRDNLAAPIPNGDGTAVPIIDLGDAGFGAIAATDAIDIVTGNPTTTTGLVNSATVSGGSATVVLDSLDPLSPNDLDGGVSLVGPMLAFGAPGAGCFGKLVGGAVGTTITVLTYPDLERDLTGPGVAVPGCPAANMSVYAMMTRKRYLIYQEADGTFGLYAQTLRDPPGATRLGVLGPPVLVVNGIEDLQVRWNVGGGVWCNQGGTGDCDVMAGLVTTRGAEIHLVARSEDASQRQGEFRPALLNHAAGLPDNVPRYELSTATFFRNLVYAGP